MKRALVLTDDVTRHPFRRHFLEVAETPRRAVKPAMGDTAFFLLSFVSGFIVFYGMIA